MDPDKLAFLFGEIPDGFDRDDEDDRALLLIEQLGDDDDRDEAATRFRLTIQTVIANQIALGEPPEVWQAAQRMTAEGVDRVRAIGNLVLAFLGPLHTTLTEQSEFDEERYRERLVSRSRRSRIQPCVSPRRARSPSPKSFATPSESARARRSSSNDGRTCSSSARRSTLLDGEPGSPSDSADGATSR